MTNFNFDSKFLAKAEFLSDTKFFAPTKFFGAIDLDSGAAIKDVFEKTVVRTDYESGSININLSEGSLVNFTVNCPTNFTINISGSAKVGKTPAVPLRDYLPIGRSIVLTILMPMGSSAYVMSNPTTSGFKIDGVNTIVKWINSTSPTSGFASATNVYTFAIIRNDKKDYTVLGTLSSFG